MSEIVKRVARTVNLSLAAMERDVRISEITDGEIVEIARSAVEAMREPTKTMLDAVYERPCIGMSDAWRCMIDVALNRVEA